MILGDFVHESHLTYSTKKKVTRNSGGSQSVHSVEGDGNMNTDYNIMCYY